MAKKSKSILLVVLLVTLLLVVSSRVTPGNMPSSKAPKITDDPIAETTEPAQAPEDVPTVTPEPTPNIREILPGVSTKDWNLKLVNNIYILPSTFAPDVSETRNSQYIDSRIVDTFEAMLTAAEEAGHTVNVRVAYRPFSSQAYLFNGKASQIQWGTTMTLMEAETEARKVVAYPGTSDHQLGLSADIMNDSQTAMNAEEAAQLPLIQWLNEHCAEYGFIPRYPEDKREITGWFEPWHFRYVGQECAQYMMENNLCLEEFIALFNG
ncbi:MAG: D-alanyl-D-alanine carboxypeptidase family protein [Ruminococcaceae bacterium]|nr:D-alanyl-D-alanine carboxypeptidase family protein [Oscillospiraceae bacterium]